MSDIPVKILNSKLIHQGRIFKVVEKEVSFQNKNKSTYSLIEHDGAVAVIPQLDAQTLILIKQYRVALNDFLLEFPAGCIEKGEEPLACATREIAEEVKYQAGEMIPMGVLHPAPGFCNEVQHCFLARNLTPAFAEADQDEFIEIKPMKISEIEKAICDNVLTDAKSIAIFSRARLLGLI
jgi:ADP-ribose pyrophosphatase